MCVHGCVCVRMHMCSCVCLCVDGRDVGVYMHVGERGKEKEEGGSLHSTCQWVGVKICLDIFSMYL